MTAVDDLPKIARIAAAEVQLGSRQMRKDFEVARRRKDRPNG